MASSFPLLFFFFLSLSLFSLSSPALAQLSVNYYTKTCPKFEDIMRETIISKQLTIPTTAAAILRTFFHDCMVDGCDASVLISPSTFHKSERESDINHSLPGDAFDLIVRAKTALEMECPGVVSCADILAYATRNLVKQQGGPFFVVKLGRKDSLVSDVTHVEPNLARSNFTVAQMLPSFESKGFTVQEMVALVGGGHTIGFAHCIEFTNRLFGAQVDPSLNPKFAEMLKKLCADRNNTQMAAFLDPITANKFDNMIFQNWLRGLSILSSDNAMVTDLRTKPVVEMYAKDQALFFKDFAAAMEKLSLYGVKTGNQGEVRNRCDAFNSIQT